MHYLALRRCAMQSCNVTLLVPTALSGSLSGMSPSLSRGGDWEMQRHENGSSAEEYERNTKREKVINTCVSSGDLCSSDHSVQHLPA
jgi:hypothetical protein